MSLRHTFALAAATLLALGCAIAPAAAQDWPARAVTMVVPFPPGGGTDVLGRIIGRRLSEILGQQVIIENVGGAGGMIAAAKAARADPDGYTILLHQDALAAGVFEGEVVRRHDRIELLADALNLRLASLSFSEVTGLLPN